MYSCSYSTVRHHILAYKSSRHLVDEEGGLNVHVVYTKYMHIHACQAGKIVCEFYALLQKRNLSIVVDNREKQHVTISFSSVLYRISEHLHPT